MKSQVSAQAEYLGLQVLVLVKLWNVGAGLATILGIAIVVEAHNFSAQV